MPDISKCDGEGCPRRDRCYRYVTPGCRWQSSFAAPPLCEDGCEEFIPLKEKETDHG